MYLLLTWYYKFVLQFLIWYTFIKIEKIEYFRIKKALKYLKKTTTIILNYSTSDIINYFFIK